MKKEGSILNGYDEYLYKDFHGYSVVENGVVLGKNGKPIKTQLRERNGGKKDVVVRLHINGKSVKFTLSRLVVACFQGPVYGYEVNHKDRNPLNNNNSNLERMTPSENQKHWRNCELGK